MYSRPIEVLPILWKRPRLKHLVPIEELLRVMESYKINALTLQNYMKKIIKGADEIFSQDLLDFYILEKEMNKGIYVLSFTSKNLLKERLSVSYSDGIEFKFFSFKIKDEKFSGEIREISEAEEKALKVIQESKKLGEELGIEVKILQH